MKNKGELVRDNEISKRSIVRHCNLQRLLLYCRHFASFCSHFERDNFFQDSRLLSFNAQSCCRVTPSEENNEFTTAIIWIQKYFIIVPFAIQYEFYREFYLSNFESNFTKVMTKNIFRKYQSFTWGLLIEKVWLKKHTISWLEWS